MAPEKSRPRSPESRRHSAAHASDNTICAANPASEASAGRNAAAVGTAATSAVVAGIVGVIALDAVIDLCANVLGI